jgi:adenosylcobinamide-GDP ribazoletransferase
MRILILMLQFMTRLPLPVEIQVEPADFPRGVKYFPLVGLTLGALNVLFFWILNLKLERGLNVVLLVLLNIMVTGALHLDGLADTCDGLFSARGKERMLEIMRDSRIGTNGAIAIFFDLALKIVLLGQLKDCCLIKGILLAPVISRTLMVLLIMTCPPARAGSGMGNLFIGQTRWRDAIGAFVFCLIAVVVGCGYQALPLLGLNLLAGWCYRRLVLRKIGGMTGDTLGALNEVSEVVSLLALVFFCGPGFVK